MRRYLSRAALAIAVVLTAAFLPTTAVQAAQPDGVHQQYVDTGFGICMQSNGLNAQATLNTCTGAANQAWSQSVNYRNCCGFVYRQIINKANGTCVGVRNGQAGVKGIAVVTGGCGEVNDQYGGSHYLTIESCSHTTELFRNEAHCRVRA
jgi:hypothetical protein